MRKLVYYLVVTLVYFCLSLGVVMLVDTAANGKLMIPFEYYAISVGSTVLVMLATMNQWKLKEE